MPRTNSISDLTATVTANREVARGFWKMSLAAPGVKFKPGQFFQLRIHGDSTQPLLRRPFAPSEVSENGFSFIYAVVGAGTAAMTRLSKGAETGVLAPLGNGYNLPRKGRVLLVGGGCGTPSLRFTGEVLAARGLEVYSIIGARTACTLLEVEALKKISTLCAVATDDGSAGLHGHAVQAAEVMLEEIGLKPKPVILACGPEPMLKGLAKLAAEKKLSCQVSLEERMACGFGACMGCAVAVKADNEDGFIYKRVCADGPVFEATALAWS
jgi:dihydroorotate dehydrogenase electron transfer subunit